LARGEVTGRNDEDEISTVDREAGRPRSRSAGRGER
jgi:hypothetical protein